MTMARVIGLAGGMIAAAGIAVLSQVPLPQSGGQEAVLRLTWRARPERIEECHEQSPDALKALPPHMRQPVICEGANASYQLEVLRDSTVLLTAPVHPGGLRRDRPLYVFHEIHVPAGPADITVRFTRIGGDTAGAPDANATSAGRDASRRHEELIEAVPAALTYNARLDFSPGQVRLISYDPERRALFEIRP
ncbi:MAG: hypothetical protein IT184_06555 [Acidobacteria bacterium]|nr:hypothetical protein [Acidobacteriota bacterium]